MGVQQHRIFNEIEVFVLIIMLLDVRQYRVNIENENNNCKNRCLFRRDYQRLNFRHHSDDNHSFFTNQDPAVEEVRSTIFQLNFIV
jgi:hypothetical protein